MTSRARGIALFAPAPSGGWRAWPASSIGRRWRSTYDALAALGSTMALGRPAELIASLERCALLKEMNEHDRLAREARHIDRRLTSADWRVSASQFHFYRGLVDEWLDDSPTGAEDSVAAARDVIAAGVLALRRDSPEIDAASGRQTFSWSPDLPRAGDRRQVFERPCSWVITVCVTRQPSGSPPLGA